MLVADRIIFDASPLISLHKAGALAACLQLPFDFLTTPQVVQELSIGESHGLQAIPLAGIVVQPLSEDIDPILLDELDLGEASVIQLARESSGSWACLDEAAARSLAKAEGLRVIGAVGLLILAKEAGLIGAIKPMLESMLTGGIHLSDEIIAKALQIAGESDATP